MKQAVAIASEIRLERPYSQPIITYYQTVSGSVLSIHAIERSRERLQQIVFGLELTMSIQRGHVQSMLPVPGLRGSACKQLESFADLEDDCSTVEYSGYLHASNLAINQMTVGSYRLRLMLDRAFDDPWLHAGSCFHTLLYRESYAVGGGSLRSRLQ